MPAPLRYRALEVPEPADGMRLDRFLARRFSDRSRTWFARGIREGLVRDEQDEPLRGSTRLRAGAILRLYLPGLAPSTPPPPMPTVLYEDERVAVVDKPAGLLAHPTGTRFAWSVIGVARDRWPDVHLVHRLDRDTSGAMLLAKDDDANRFLKAQMKAGALGKVYEALARGRIGWSRQRLEGPIGPAGGVIRIQMAVREDGLSARTDVEVLERCPTMTRVRCILHTGRTHQIRVHLHHAGHALVGDRMYGVPPEVFLRTLEHGADRVVIAAAGAPRHALHASTVRFPHPDGGEREVTAPWPSELARWWDEPGVLPHDEDQPDATRPPSP